MISFSRHARSVGVAALMSILAMLASAKAEDGVLEDRIVFGQSAAFEGPAASLGTGVREGILAAFNEINEAGGIHGRSLTLISYDDGYEPERAIANTRRLIDEDGVFGLAGEVGTPTSRAAQPLAEEKGIPFIGAFTGAEFLRDPNLQTVINVRASYNQETETLIDYLVSSLGLTKVAILYQDDTFGRAGLSGLTKALDKRNIQPVVDATYMRNTTAVKRALLTIRKADPQAVIIVGAYKPAAEFIRTADEIGFSALFAALSFVGSSALVAELGPVGEDVLITQVMPPFHEEGPPLVNRFQDALAASIPDMEPSFVALEGYVVGRLIGRVLEEIGPEPTRDEFLNAFKSKISFNLDGLILEYGPDDNQGSDEVFLTTIQSDGSLTSLKEIRPK